MLAGIGGSALVAALKDVLVLGAVVGLGIALPWQLYGGIGPMFDRIVAERPGFLVLPAAGMSPSWFGSTVLLTACGFYMWPHTFGSVFSARNAGRVPAQCGDHAALPAHPALRVLHRIRGAARGPGAHRQWRRPRAASRDTAGIRAVDRRCRRRGADCSPRWCPAR